ncbi:monocarboxylate transporter 12 [Homalodisca vitripennis]|uniref:monocarboxylate transporter 12 n=1 Tax=Homalodisca vitripennis TaxID=197043 RepID=UPI001EEC3BC2|nr:monocarboxylate transporter 12 [Homalodisca vitripennis]
MTKVPEKKDPDLPPPPDGGWGWVVVFASFMIHIVNDGVTYTFGLFLVEFRSYFNEGAGATAWISSILAGVTLCSGPISSAFVNKYGCRPVTIVGAILGSVSLVASAYVSSVYMLYITIGLGTGFGFGLIYLPAIVSVTCYFEKYRSLATGIAVCGSGLGTFVFAPLTQWLIETLGWQKALIVMGCLVLKCVIYGVLFRPLEMPASRAMSMEEIKPLKENNTPILKAVLNGNADDEQRRPHSVHTFVTPKHANGLTLTAVEDEDIVRTALSQPMLMTDVTTGGRVRLHSESSSVRSAQSGIMYRKDVLYRGSLHNIPPENRKNSSIPEKVMMGKEQDDKVVVCGCFPCHQETRDTLNEMLDLSLLKDPIFIIFSLSNFFTSIGFYVPYTFIVAMAEVQGLSKPDQSFLLAVIGVANTVGRIVLGYLSDKTWVNRLYVYNVCLTICGISTILSALCYDFLTFCIYAATFGFMIGAYVGLTSVILVDLLGLNKLTNAFGLLLLFQGIASFLGPPIAGWLYDALQSYNPGFYVAGGTLAISGLMLFVVPTLQRRLNKNQALCVS